MESVTYASHCVIVLLDRFAMHSDLHLSPGSLQNLTYQYLQISTLATQPTSYIVQQSADTMQAINYFLEPTRLQNSSYFWRFLDIIKSPAGKPLLDQLAASTDKLVGCCRP